MESMSIFVLVCIFILAYYHYPRVPIGGRAVPLSGSLDKPTSSYDSCGPDCIVCPRCDMENTLSYTYCSGCLGELRPQ